MSRVISFPPLANSQARVLVLGSMPGKRSLELQQYYGHPRNAFWKIMEDLWGIPAALPYEERIARLLCEGVAVWDVMQSCVREGSLDASIVEASIIVNDFPNFFSHHPQVRHVFFNGAKAEQAFRKYVVVEKIPAVTCVRLPSTSPANAATRYPQKLQAWQQLQQAVE